MIELSEEAKRLTSTFLAYRNDIDIYTEDEEKDKEFYNVLFKRLLKNDIIINDITPLGSKNVVINRCKDEPENGRKKLFIIDGDVAIIHGDSIPQLKNLFVHDAYCIENYLIEKETIIHFIYLNCAVRPKQAIIDELDFDNWLNSYSNSLIDLFIHFAMLNYLGRPFALYNANKYHVKENGVYKFSEKLVYADINLLKIEILKEVTEVQYLTKHNELKQFWVNDLNTLLTIVSGKDYLIPILLFKTQCFKKSKSLPSLEEIKMALVQYCDLTKLQKLKYTIEQL